MKTTLPIPDDTVVKKLLRLKRKKGGDGCYSNRARHATDIVAGYIELNHEQRHFLLAFVSRVAMESQFFGYRQGLRQLNPKGGAS